MPFETILGLAWPADAAGWTLLVVGIASLPLLPWLWRRVRVIPLWSWVALWALLAAAASAVYIAIYLRGGPRIIDATSYWLAARGLAEGLVTWQVPVPTASFRGRFLLSLVHDGTVSVGVIFPPGYPTVLALGFLVRAPMAVGPVLAAALVFVTAALARRVTGHADGARIAAVLSALNACLRYHTADTMSHGLAALCLVGAVVLALHAASRPRSMAAAASWTASGFAAAWLFCTRPASALALLVVAVPAIGGWAWRCRSFAPLWALVGAVPPLLWLVVHQHALTGAWLQASQTSYYLLADGPAGCFRYGFGAGIGCRVEHAPYVESVLPDGYGLAAALRTTGRRLYLHVADITNYAPLAVLVPVGAWLTRRRAAARLSVAITGALVLAYAPFYFDGSYLGGGARLLSEALPFEHALLAGALVAWAARFSDPGRGTGWAVGATLAALCLGFALHASHGAVALRDRDGGRPLYEPAVVRAALGASPQGVLFLDTDHGFNLAFDPRVQQPRDGLLVARARYDDRDRLLWQRLGRPQAWLYRVRPWDAPGEPPRVEPWVPPGSDVLRFEGEAEWPPLHQQGGYAAATHLPASCVSGHRALGLTPTSERACVAVEVPIPGAGVWEARPWLVVPRPAEAEMWLEGDDGAVLPWTEQGQVSSALDSCVAWSPMRIAAAAPAWRTLTLCAYGGWVALDRVELSSAKAGTD